MTGRTITSITGYDRIDGVVPGVRGQRAFPTRGRTVLDPFVMLDHIGPETLPDGFYVDGHMHPHRGFETLTMMFEGVMYHLDSTGLRETLPSGSTQNMRAGSGIQHGGDMAADPETNVFHEVQLWVTTPAAHKMDPPAINTAQPGDMPIIDRGDHRVEVVTGTLEGLSSPLTTTQPTRVLHATADAAAQVEIDHIDPAWSALVYVLRGSVLAGGHVVEQFATVSYAADGDAVSVAAGDEGAELLVLTGLPTGEPIAMGGPWVMNTREELAQADTDFRAGLF